MSICGIRIGRRGVFESGIASNEHYELPCFAFLVPDFSSVFLVLIENVAFELVHH